MAHFRGNRCLCPEVLGIARRSRIFNEINSLPPSTTNSNRHRNPGTIKSSLLRKRTAEPFIYKISPKVDTPLADSEKLTYNRRWSMFGGVSFLGWDCRDTPADSIAEPHILLQITIKPPPAHSDISLDIPFRLS